MTTRGGGCRTGMTPTDRRHLDSLRTGARHGQLANLLGTVLSVFIVALVMLGNGIYHLWWAGVDHTLHTYGPLRGIELVLFPLAAIVAAWLCWGAEWIAGLRASRVGPLLPLFGAAVLFAVFRYIGFWWEYREELPTGYGPFVVQRTIGAALVAVVAYIGMVLFPRVTASLAGAIVGPTLFAVVGYFLFPSFMRDPGGRLAEVLVVVFNLGAIAVAIGAIVAMLRSQRLRQRPLSHAIWMGALMLCLAVSGTFNGTYPGR